MHVDKSNTELGTKHWNSKFKVSIFPIVASRRWGGWSNLDFSLHVEICWCLESASLKWQCGIKMTNLDSDSDYNLKLRLLLTGNSVTKFNVSNWSQQTEGWVEQFRFFSARGDLLMSQKCKFIISFHGWFSLQTKIFLFKNVPGNSYSLHTPNLRGGKYWLRMLIFSSRLQIQFNSNSKFERWGNFA